MLRPAPRPPSPSRIALQFVRSFGLLYCIARCIRLRSRSRSSISEREFPTTAAVTRTPPFPFRIVPLHTLPSSYIHLPNVLSAVFAVDTFHSSAVPGHMRFLPYRVSHMPPFPEERK